MSIELESEWHDVGLAVGTDGRQTGERLRSQIGDLLRRE
jgi:hypothetical protein